MSEDTRKESLVFERVADPRRRVSRAESEAAKLRLAVGSLLDIVDELAQAAVNGERAEPGWADLVRKTLWQHKKELGLR